MPRLFRVRIVRRCASFGRALVLCAVYRAGSAAGVYAGALSLVSAAGATQSLASTGGTLAALRFASPPAAALAGAAGKFVHQTFVVAWVGGAVRAFSSVSVFSAAA